MDNTVINQIASMIGTLGFPIVCCYFLWKFINTTMKDFTQSLNANTDLLKRICGKLDMLDEKGDEKNE